MSEIATLQTEVESRHSMIIGAGKAVVREMDLIQALHNDLDRLEAMRLALIQRILNPPDLLSRAQAGPVTPSQRAELEAHISESVRGLASNQPPPIPMNWRPPT